MAFDQINDVLADLAGMVVYGAIAEAKDRHNGRGKAFPLHMLRELDLRARQRVR